MAGGLSTGCSAGPSGPVGAALEITLASPAQDDGAILFTVTGGPIDSLQVAATGYTLYSSRPDPNTLRGIITGDLAAGALARIYIADESRIPQYSATVDQVAARATYARRDPAGYSLVLSP